MSEFMHWCGNCQIRAYIQRHYNKDLNWQDCPYVCEYATAMRCSTKTLNENEMKDDESHPFADSAMIGD